MSSTQILAFLVALADLAVGGLISNCFILKVIVTGAAMCRSLASNDQLLLSVSVSNISIAAAMAASLIMPYSVTTFSCDVALSVVYFYLVFFTFFRYWVIAWLSFFYCIKIVNSSHSFFLWCKLRISWLIPRLLLGSLVISSAVSIFMFQNILIYHLSNTTTEVMNVNQGSIAVTFSVSFKKFILAVGCGLPLLVILLSSVLVVASLYRHVCRMTSEESSFRSLQTKVHSKAAIVVLSFLLLYVSFYMAQTLIITTDVRGFTFILATVVKLINAPAQAAILMLVNPKLKQAATQILQRPKTLTS